MASVKELLIQSIGEVSATTDFKENHRAQADILYAVVKVWDTMAPSDQDSVRLELMRCIPRIGLASNPKLAMEQLVELQTINSRSAKADLSWSIQAHFPAPPYIPDPDDILYPKHGWIGNFLEYAKHSSVPTGFNFWAAVTALGAAAKHRVFIDRGKSRMYMNWYTLLCGGKSTGKSASKDLINDIVRRTNRFIAGDPLGAASKEPSGKLIRILGEDSTKESLIEELKTRIEIVVGPDGKVRREMIDSTGFLIIDELVNLLGRQQYGVEQKVGFLTAIHSTETYKKSTLTSGVAELDNIALSMLACCAPAWMLGTLTPVMLDGGVMDRWRVIHRPEYFSPRIYSTPHPGDPVLATYLAKQLVPWAELTEDLELMMTKEALQWYDEWYHTEHARLRRVPSSENLSLNRAANQLIKLGGNLCMSEGIDSPYIELQHIEKAGKIMSYEAKHYGILMGTVHSDPFASQMDTVEKFLLAYNGLVAQVTLHERLRKKKGFLPWKEKGKVFLDDLIEAKHIVIVGTKAGGKTKYYCLTKLGLKHLKGTVMDDKALDKARETLNQFGVEQLSDVERGRLEKY